MRRVTSERLIGLGAKYEGERKIVDRYMLVPSTGRVVKVRWEDGTFQIIYKSDDVSGDMTKDWVKDSIKLMYGDNPFKMLHEVLGVRKLLDVPKLRKEFTYDGMKMHVERIYELGPVFKLEFEDKKRMLEFVDKLGYGERNFEKNTIFKMLCKYYNLRIVDGVVYVGDKQMEKFDKVQQLPEPVYTKVLGKDGVKTFSDISDSMYL
jgi:adenylate cyclase class IV